MIGHGATRSPLMLGMAVANGILLFLFWSVFFNRGETIIEVNSSRPVEKSHSLQSAADHVSSLRSYKDEQTSFCASNNFGPAKPATVEEVNGLLQKLGDGYTAVFRQLPGSASVGGMPFVQFMYAGNADYISKQYLEGNVGMHIWEEHIVRPLDWAMKKLSTDPRYGINKVPLVLDIGGNVGSMTLQMAAAGYEVITVEAMPSNMVLLRSSLCANTPDIANRVTLIHKGVDKVAQVCHIEAPADNVGNGMLVCEDMPKVNTYIKRPGDIETARIDDLIPPELAARIGVLKLDIEGNEHRALLGAAQTILANKVPYLSIEIYEKFLHERGSSSLELLRLLHDHGYMMSAKGFEGPFLNWDDLLSYPRRYNIDQDPNYFFVHSSYL